MKIYSCPITAKKCFRSRMSAEIRIIDIDREAGVPFYSYLCPHCDYWHLSRTPNFEALIELNLGWEK